MIGSWRDKGGKAGRESWIEWIPVFLGGVAVNVSLSDLQVGYLPLA